MPIIDRYRLQPSPPITIDGREEETANIPLQQAPGVDAGNVSGSVRRPDGTMIPLATVKLFNSLGVPFEHTNSNPGGQFIFPRIPVGSYFITASEPGFLTPLRIPISVLANRTTMVTITMQPDADAPRGAFFGIVKNSADNTPIADATVELFQMVAGIPQLIGIVSTNETGQYLFARLTDGIYFITASKAGFLSSQSTPVDLAGREFVPQDVILPPDPDANTGTISGIVTDSQSGQPIAQAIVALYSIANGTETIIDITKSNDGGLYLFGDLPAGTYRVKATVQIEG